MRKYLTRKNTLIALLLTLISVLTCCLVFTTTSSKTAKAASSNYLEAGDYYWDYQIKPGTSDSVGGFYSIEFSYNVSKDAIHKVKKLEFFNYFGSSGYSIQKTTFEPTEGVDMGNYYQYKIIAVGDINSIGNDVMISGCITHSQGMTSSRSNIVNLIYLWEEVIGNKVSYPKLSNYSIQEQQLMKGCVEAYKNNMDIDIKVYQDKFVQRTSTSLSMTDRIYRFPIENFWTAAIVWSKTQDTNYDYHINIMIKENFAIVTNVYKVQKITNDNVSSYSTESDAVTYATGTPIVDESLSQRLSDAIETYVYDGYFYFRINDISVVEEYMVNMASVSMSVSAQIKDSSTNCMQVLDGISSTPTTLETTMRNELASSKLKSSLFIDIVKAEHRLDGDYFKLFVNSDTSNDNASSNNNQSTETPDIGNSNEPSETPDVGNQDAEEETTKKSSLFAPWQIGLMSVGGLIIVILLVVWIVAKRRR